MTMTVPLWLAVKQVTADSVADAQGNKVCAAISTRITRPATFSDYTDLVDLQRVIPLDVAIELDQHGLRTGNPPRHALFVAETLGFLLVPHPRGLLVDCDMSALCKISTESAEAIATFAQARADGVTTPDEAKLVRQKIADAQTAFAELDARMARIESGEGEE
jgi:hypothetical protein